MDMYWAFVLNAELEKFSSSSSTSSTSSTTSTTTSTSKRKLAHSREINNCAQCGQNYYFCQCIKREYDILK